MAFDLLVADFARRPVWLMPFPVDAAAVQSFVFAVDALITAAGTHTPPEARMVWYEHWLATPGTVVEQPVGPGQGRAWRAIVRVFETIHADGRRTPSVVIDTPQNRISHLATFEGLAAQVANRWIGLRHPPVFVTARR